MKGLIKRAAVITGASGGCAIVAWKMWRRTALRRDNRAIPSSQKIVIVGASFAGLNEGVEKSV